VGRWVTWVLLVLFAPADARAKIVIMDPPVVRQCPHGASWENVEACLRKHGTPTVLKSLPAARLVHLEQVQGATHYDGGMYLYMQRGKEWKLAGLYENRGGDYDLIGIEPVTVGKHTGFRVDIGQQYRSAVQPDGVTSVPAVFASHIAMFCGGDSWRCTEVITSCDVLVHGGAVYSFRGKLDIEDNMIHVRGDRSHVGSFCAVPEQEPLGWTQ